MIIGGPGLAQRDILKLWLLWCIFGQNSVHVLGALNRERWLL